MSNIRKLWYLHKVMKQQWLKTAELEEIIESSTEVNYAEVQKGDVKHTLADVGMTKKLVGYEPSVSIKDGLNRFVERYKVFGGKYKLDE